MDDLIDAYISSPMWSERNTASMVTWSGTTVTHTDDFHANSEEQFGNARDPSICMAPLSHIVGNTATGYFNMQERDFTSSLFVDRNMKYEALKDVYSGEGFSHQSLFHHTPDAVSMDYVTQHRASTTAATAKSALPRAVVGMSRSIERNSHELSAFSQCLENDHSIASDASIGLDNLPAFVYQGNKNCNNLFEEIPLQNRGFYLDRCHSASIPIEDQDNLHGLSSVSVGPQTNLIATALQPQMEQNGLRSPSVPVGSCMMTSNKLAGIPSAQKPSPPYEGHVADCQIKNSYGSQSQAVSANSSGCNGAVKPRVRARRGQATDPHSIAERHRREKISERLKDLQGLVPSSNKADKASVLDEIINYVKFLQHQVKVLSMSRLGATGAVVPLLTHTQTEGNLLRSSSVGQGASNDDPDNSDCEQEVMKLMETDITSAMQYLQFKGLCLMPLALATELNAPPSTVQPLV